MTHDKNDTKSASSETSSGDEAERKERVLHTRVPESLDDAIRAAASELGVSVSNLVRNVLANALEVVEAATLTVPRKAAAAAATVRGGGAAAAGQDAGAPHGGGAGHGGGAHAAAGAAAGAAGAASVPVPPGSSHGAGASSPTAATAAGPGSSAAAPPPEPEIEPRVLGWQEAILNLNAICDACNAILPRGTRAAIAIPDRGAAARAVRCPSCLEELVRDAGR